MTDTPEQPEDDARSQDMDLESQLDSLLERLEEADPKTVPADLRHPPEELQPAEAATEPAPEPVAESVPSQPEPDAKPPSEEPAPQPVGESPQPAAAMVDPADSGVDEKPAKPTGGFDLDTIAAMAADLLNNQVDQTIDAASKPADPAPAPQQADGPAQPVAESTDDAPSTEPVAATPDEPAKPQPSSDQPDAKAASLTEDDLAGQIQSLLNDVKQQDQAPAPPAETDKPAEPVAEAPSQPDTPQAQEQAVVDQSPDTDADQVPEPAQAEEPAVSIDQIDSMLAESAEQAIEQDADEAGEPTEAAHVPGTDEVLASQAQAEERAELEAKAQAELSAQASTQDQAPAPADEPQPAAVPSAGATAQDVAAELDQDAQAVPVAAEVADAGDSQGDETEPQPVSAAPSPAVVIKQGNLAKAERTLRKVCGVINSPLRRVSPELRDTVGYVSILILGSALSLLAFGLLF